MTDLHVSLGPLSLQNPVMPASGTFGYGEEYSAFLDLNRLGAIVTKGISLKPREGNPPPRLWETWGGMLNSIGLQNVGLEVFVKEKLPFLRRFHVPIIVNCFGFTETEYVTVAEQLDSLEGIAALEVNLSCPNIKEGGIHFGCDASMVAGLIGKIRDRVRLPIIVKLSALVSDLRVIAQAAEQGGADALTLINSVPGMAIDVETRRSRLGGSTGGLSGPAIKPIAVKAVWEAASAVSIPIIGVGGIRNHRDALEFIMAGATALQIGTANFVNPLTMIEIIDGMAHFMRERQIPSLSSLIGSVAR